MKPRGGWQYEPSWRDWVLDVVKPHRPVQFEPWTGTSIVSATLIHSSDVPKGSVFEITSEGVTTLVRRWRWIRPAP